MFMALPVKVHDGSRRDAIPVANALIIAVNVLAFWLGPWPVGRETGLFSIVAYGFSHAGLMHLIGNMWFLLVVGSAVNRRLGNGYYLLAYLGTILFMGIFARLFIGGLLVGSSGAIFAMTGIFLMLMPAAWIDVFYFALFPLTVLVGLFHRPAHWLWWLIRWDTVQLRAWWFLLLVPLMELWGLFWWGWNWTNLGHLCGLLCGVVIVLLLPTEISMRRRSSLSEA